MDPKHFVLAGEKVRIRFETYIVTGAELANFFALLSCFLAFCLERN